MNSDASHFLFFSFDDDGAKADDLEDDTEDLDDPEDEDDLEDEEDDDPFEVSTTNPWEYDDQDNF